MYNSFDHFPKKAVQWSYQSCCTQIYISEEFSKICLFSFSLCATEAVSNQRGGGGGLGVWYAYVNSTGSKLLSSGG